MENPLLRTFLRRTLSRTFSEPFWEARGVVRPLGRTPNGRVPAVPVLGSRRPSGQGPRRFAVLKHSLSQKGPAPVPATERHAVPSISVPLLVSGNRDHGNRVSDSVKRHLSRRHLSRRHLSGLKFFFNFISDGGCTCEKEILFR